MGKGLTDFAMQAGQQAVGGIMGLALGGINDRRQLKQAEKLQELEIRGQREMSEFNQMQQMEMWHNTGYGAQMKQLKDAGLNAGLIYGMSGGGAQTASSTPGSVSGKQAPTGGGEAVAMAGQTMQLGLMRAQKDLLEAQAEETRSRIPGNEKEPGLKEAQTGSLIQGIANQKAQESLTIMQREIARTADSVSRQTMKEQMRVWEQMVEKNDKEIEAMKLANQLSTDQMEDKKRLMKAEIASTIMDSYLKNAQISGIGQQIKESQRRVINMIQENMRAWDSLSNENKGIFMKQLDQEWEQSGLPPGLKDILDQVFIIPGGKPGQVPIRGFHNR
ncbi:MAG: DNA pilot protein [Microviridae sp.]|nr:MAG: DNA pilot protein [Microviridae sp.]